MVLRLARTREQCERRKWPCAKASVLAHIAEVDARRLYLPAGYPSMYEYCVRKLRYSEQAAMKRIRAGRTARRFPAIFHAVAENRLHLSAVVLLTPHLTSDNADELLAAAECKTKGEIEQLLALRFPKPDVPTRLEVIASPRWLTSAGAELSPGTVGTVTPQLSPGTVGALAFTGQLATGQGGDDAPDRAGAISGQRTPAQVAADLPRPRVTPLSAERFALQLTIDKLTHDKLRYVQALMSHQLPSGDVAQVFARALDALLAQLEKQKFAATTKPRRHSCRASANSRHFPAYVRRAVWQRDRGQCTFVSEDGQRCGARKFLQYDHVDPVARGGQATVERVRLMCRGHNQLEAERTFGAGFMSEKREQAQRAAAETRARASTETGARARAAEGEVRSGAVASEHAEDPMTGLRKLGLWA